MASSVKLGAALDDYVEQLVEKGRYGSRSEVLREGVRLVQEREDRFAAISAQIAEGRAQIRRGEGIPLEEAFDRLEARFAVK